MNTFLSVLKDIVGCKLPKKIEASQQNKQAYSPVNHSINTFGLKSMLSDQNIYSIQANAYNNCLENRE